MRLLSFDTSNQAVHIALTDGDSLITNLQEAMLQGSRQDIARLLLPSIDQVIKHAGWSKEMIDGIVVGSGPGSFTGVRSAVVVARTIAQALDLPCIAVSLFDCFAFDLQSPCVIVRKAGPDQLFAARYEGNNNDLPQAKEALFLPIAEISSLVREGDAIYAQESLVSDLAKHNISAEPVDEFYNVAIAQVWIGLEKIRQSGQTDRKKIAEVFAWQNIEPLYLRAPSVTVKPSGNTN